MSASMGEALWDGYTWIFDHWREILIALAAVGFIGWVAWYTASQPSCRELGGTIYQVGTREETYVMYTVKVGEISVPVYGNRTVPVYDCIGER